MNFNNTKLWGFIYMQFGILFCNAFVFQAVNAATLASSDKQANIAIGRKPRGPPLEIETKVEVAMEQLRKKSSSLEKYIFLHTIQDGDDSLYYAILLKHTTEVMPFVYTPTVGEACEEWSRIYRHTPRGIYLSIHDRGNVKNILQNHPNKNIKVIVFTDGERILGLGDLGANGMGIPIGKLALYTACGGIDPSACLPVHIDVGTNTLSILEDKSYMGLRQKRDRSENYDLLIAEFFDACKSLYGENVLMQFEDFGNLNAFRLLDEYKAKANCFNDDVQGTASVVLAGFISSLKLTKKNSLNDHTYLFFGAGEAGIGIADLLASAIVQESGGKISMEQAKAKCWFVDSKGLITADRLKDSSRPLEHHKIPYAHALPDGVTLDKAKNLLDIVTSLKPTALVGVSAQGNTFTQEVCAQMAQNDANPLIMALSNPTSKAECSAEDAYKWTNGAAVYCSGSPFDPVTLSDGTERVPGQGNNAYIFPGLGLGSIVSQARTITDQDFYVAASTLASLVTPEMLAKGCCYPPLSQIRDVSARIAAAVAEFIVSDGRSDLPASAQTPAEGWFEKCISQMYNPMDRNERKREREE